MTAKCALCVSLLSGNVLDINKIHKETSYTNSGREIPRMIEHPFGVEVSRTTKNGYSRWGVSVQWCQYRLNRSEYNIEGIKKMITYVKKNMPVNPKTEKELMVVKDINKVLSAYNNF